MTSLVSWGEIGVDEEADAASDCTDLAVTSEAAPRSALAHGSERSIARESRIVQRFVRRGVVRGVSDITGCNSHIEL